MPTYRTSGRNQFRTPLGAVGDPPDVPGYLATFSDDLDNILGVGGAEYCANAAAVSAIPSSRRFPGKLAFRADNNTTYRWVGVGNLNTQGNDTTHGWQAWAAPAQAFTPTYTGVTLGTGATNQGLAGISDGMQWVHVWTLFGTGATFTAAADTILTNVPGNGLLGEWTFGSGFYRPAAQSGNGVMVPVVPYAVNATVNAATGALRIRVPLVSGTLPQLPKLYYLRDGLAAGGVTPVAGDVLTFQIQGACSGVL